MAEYETGAVRQTGGKGRMDLLPWIALIRVSQHMEDALTHYPERNWEQGLPMHTMIDSAFRHLAKYVAGQDDEDHLCAATTNLLMAMWTEMEKPEMMDIPTRKVHCKRGCEHYLPNVMRCILSKDYAPSVDCRGDASKCEQHHVTYDDVHDIVEE